MFENYERETTMREETQSFIIIGVIVLVLIVLLALSYNYEKTECLAEGGKWISGMLGGNYSYFCIPK